MFDDIQCGVMMDKGRHVIGICGDCVHVSIETQFSTLSLEGKPTLGRCPYYKDGRYRVLLSQRCCAHFKAR